MYSLIIRSQKEAVQKHMDTPVRVYETDKDQAERVKHTRALVLQAICALRKDSCSIVELGCGTGDISGPFAETHRVYGFDCSIRAAGAAKLRYPKMKLRVHPLEMAEPQETDIIVLCEILEHVADPMQLVRNWLPLARYSIISHPLNEDVNSTASAGEHQWGFTEEDVKGWFLLGEHEQIETKRLKVGPFDCVLTMGRRIGGDAQVLR